MGIEKKIAFLIMVHNDPAQLKKLIYALDYPYFDIFVHVDAKVDISQFKFENYRLDYSKLVVLDNRIKVYWADFSIVQATVNMYETASSYYDYIRYVTLSGNDYPLQENETIYRILSNMNVEFIMGSPTEKPEKVRYYFFEKTGLPGKVMTRVFRWLHISRNKGPFVIDGKQYTIYFAPQWHALTGECVKYILEIFYHHKSIIEQYFKYSFAPDELLIPTLLFNNEKFKKRTLRSEFPKGTHYNDMTAIHFIDYEPIVQVFTEKDAEKLLSSGKSFARKLKNKSSDKLVEIINKATNR